MTTSPTLPHLAFDTLRPLESVDGFMFCHGYVKPSAEDASGIRAMSEARGGGFIQVEQAGRYMHCLVVPRAIAEADPDFAGELVSDLVNAGLMRFMSIDCEPG